MVGDSSSGVSSVQAKCWTTLTRASRVDCCATRMLETEPDFAAQKSLLAEAIEEAGHLAIFLPNFHPELNRTFSSCHFVPIPAFVILTPRYCAPL